jgi:hypothetical protein
MKSEMQRSSDKIRVGIMDGILTRIFRQKQNQPREIIWKIKAGTGSSVISSQFNLEWLHSFISKGPVLIIMMMFQSFTPKCDMNPDVHNRREQLVRFR